MTQTTARQPGEAKMIFRMVSEALQNCGYQSLQGEFAKAIDALTTQAASTPPGAAGQAVGDLTFDERTAVGIAKESARYTRWFIDVAHGAARGSKICQDADSILALIAIIDRLIARHAAPLPGYADLVAYIERQRAWSQSTFGGGPRTEGLLRHIEKECNEVRADPLDVKEWLDIATLALDGAWRAGHKPAAIWQALENLQARNFAREWPAPQDQDTPNEHVRSPLPEPAAVEKMARAMYETDPWIESGEAIDGHQVTPDSVVTWYQISECDGDLVADYRAKARAAYAALHGEG